MWKYHRPPPRRPPPRRPPPRRSNVVDMDSFIDAFEHLIVEDEPDIFDVDFENEVRMSLDLEMALLLTQLDFETSDASDNDSYSD